jgi:hypothetical protein
MDYTPRQLEALLAIARDRERQEMIDLLRLHALAAQSSTKEGVKAINDQLKKWEA